MLFFFSTTHDPLDFLLLHVAASRRRQRIDRSRESFGLEKETTVSLRFPSQRELLYSREQELDEGEGGLNETRRRQGEEERTLG